MLVNIPHGRGPGTWTRVLVDEFGDRPRWGAMVRCPDCSRPLLARDHHIADDGQITPSLGHPTEYPPCGWHVSPKLLDWSPVPAPPPARASETCARCGARDRCIGGWGTWSQAGIICRECVKVVHVVPATPKSEG